MSDVKQLDAEFYQWRVEPVLRVGGPAEMSEPLTFISAATDFRPETEELVEGGSNLVVTEENKGDYIERLCEAHLCGGVRRELQCMLQGFYGLLPLEILRQCRVSPGELALLLSGVRDLDPLDWQQHSTGDGHQVHAWFWEVVTEF